MEGSLIGDATGQQGVSLVIVGNFQTLKLMLPMLVEITLDCYLVV
jgi:hypothetical protein